MWLLLHFTLRKPNHLKKTGPQQIFIHPQSALDPGNFYCTTGAPLEPQLGETGLLEDFHLLSLNSRLFSLIVSFSGSAFEGIKVNPPDEFDFLLLLDYKNKSHFITTERQDLFRSLYDKLPNYKLKLSLGGHRTVTQMLVKYLLDSRLSTRRQLDVDLLTYCFDNVPWATSLQLSDADKKIIADEVIWLSNTIIRFGQWEDDTNPTTKVVCLSALRYAYWFRRWCAAYLARIKNDAGVRNAVSIRESGGARFYFQHGYKSVI